MKCLISTHIDFIWVAESYFFYQRNRSIVHGGERDTLSDGAVLSRTVVTFVTWLISRTEFSSLELFHLWWTSFLEVGTARERCRDCLSNTRTFVPNDRSQCLHCVLPIMRCAFGAHQDVGLAERQTMFRFIETVRRFLPSFQGRWKPLIRQNR